MKRIISFKIDPKHYDNSPCVVWCFDNRFDGLWNLKMVPHLKAQGFLFQDPVMIAGGAKDLASPDEEFKRQRILWDIWVSIDKHSAPWIGLMTHKDCAAYGKTFESDETEAAFHVGELENAEKVVRDYLTQNHPQVKDIKIVKYFADFEGLNEI